MRLHRSASPLWRLDNTSSKILCFWSQPHGHNGTSTRTKANVQHASAVASIGELNLSPISCPSLARTEFPKLFSRTGRFLNNVVRTKFQPNFQAKQHKGRRVPIALQQRVAAELDRLISEGHVERLQRCTDDQFISPIGITAKRDGSLKLALDSKELNKQIIKNKYQMPNIDDLIDRLAEIILSRRPGHVRFSKIDLRYSYG